MFVVVEGVVGGGGWEEVVGRRCDGGRRRQVGFVSVKNESAAGRTVCTSGQAARSQQSKHNQRVVCVGLARATEQGELIPLHKALCSNTV